MNLIHDFGRLFFPHYCAGCRTPALDKSSSLCLRCLHTLPLTNFNSWAGNPIETVFAGRLPVVAGAAYCYFTQQSMMQQVLHALKYKGHRQAGRMLGRMMGRWLRESGRFDGVEALVPVPLHAAKERTRGYNQSALICEGLGEAMGLPVIADAVVRLSSTGTQTHKNSIERWQNMEGKFRLVRPSVVVDRHLLLVDDVITTGATMATCGRALQQAKGVRLSMAALAWADN